MASSCRVMRELVTDLPVQLPASGFLAGALHVRTGEIIGAGEFPERLRPPIDRADPAVAMRVLPGVVKRPGRAVLRSPFAPLPVDCTNRSVGSTAGWPAVDDPCMPMSHEVSRANLELMEGRSRLPRIGEVVCARAGAVYWRSRDFRARPDGRCPGCVGVDPGFLDASSRRSPQVRP